MKVCGRCGQSGKRFHKNRSKPDGLSHICVECRKTIDADSYQRNRVKRIAAQKERARKTREWFKEFKSTLSCGCGEDHPACMVFHHTDPSTKRFSIGDMAGGGYSIPTIRKEIAKCDVMCANCHSKLHYEEGIS